jgi:beta-hydroxylase
VAPGRAACYEARTDGSFAGVDTLFVTKVVVFAGFLGSVAYVHYRGRERLSFRRQITDHSTFLAPYNGLVYLFAGTSQRPILDGAEFPELALFRENWQVIREEAQRLYEAGYVRASERYDDLGFNSFFRKGWKRFYLKWYGAPLPSARELCPRTVALVESVPSVHGAMFALIGPRNRVGNHRDPFAGSVRYHLGLMTPNSDDCRIFVDGQQYAWRDGQDLVFDATYVHRFENLTDQPRIIFFADVERPIRNPAVRALNRWVIRHVVGMSATKNLEGEPVGLANRVFGVLYRVRRPLKRIKKANRTVYYALKYGLIVGVLYLALFAGMSALR